MLGTYRRSSVLLLALILCGHSLLWWLQPYAFLGDLDSQHYGRIATEIVSGRFAFVAHPFYDRLGLTGPTAAIYETFGIGPHTTTLWVLLASLATIGVAFLAAKRCAGPDAGLLAALLLAANPVQVQYVAHLLPDLIASGFMVGSAALLASARDREASVSRPWIRGAACSLTLVAGMTVKKTVLWLLPFFAVVMAWDLVRRRNLRLWAAIATTGVALSGLFGLLFYMMTGDPLHVFASIEATHNLSPLASFAGKSHAAFIDRLTVEPLRLLIREPGYGYLVALAVPSLLTSLRPSHTRRRGVRFWGGYLAIVLLSFWFGTTSLHSYNPLPVSPRFLIPVLPPLAVLAGIALASFLAGDRAGERDRGRVSAIAGSALLAAAAWALGWPSRAAVYSLLALVLMVVLAWPLGQLLRGRVGRAVKLAILAAIPLGMLLHEGDAGVKRPNPLRLKQYRFVRQRVARLPTDAVLLTDEHSAFVLPLILQGIGRGGPRIVDWNDSGAVLGARGARNYVYLDQTTLSMLHEWFGREVPPFARRPPGDWRQLAQRRTAWKGSDADRSDRLFRVAHLGLFEIDDPVELLPR